MEKPEREYIEYLKYQEFLKAKRYEIIDPLGQVSVAAFLAPLGAPVSRFETVVPVERYVKDEPLSEKLTQPIGAVSLRKFFQDEQARPPLDNRVFTGHGPENTQSDMTLAA